MDRNRQETRYAIDKWFERHSDEMIADLAKLIAINSVRGAAAPGAPYGESARAALGLARSMLEEHGFTAEDFEDIIITADMGGTEPVLGILAHLDIVPAGGGWDTDPFVLTERGGFLYGRGTSDDKGPAVAAMYAMYAARELAPDSFKRGFRLMLGSGEEIGCEDIAQYLTKHKPPQFVFTPDSDFPVVNIEKGRFVPEFGASWNADYKLPRVVSVSGGVTANIVPNRAEAVVEGIEPEKAEDFRQRFSSETGVPVTVSEDKGRLVFTAEGTAAHASKPELGINAQTALLDMLAAMPFADSTGFRYIKSLNRLFPHGDVYGDGLGISMSDELSGALTVNFGVLSFTETGFSGNFDSRTPECADSRGVLELTRNAFLKENIEITGHTITKCHHTPGGGEFVRTLLQIYEEYTGKKGECLAKGGTTYVHNIPGGVAFGCGMADIDDRIHGANERIGREHLILSAKMFTQAILDICCG